MSMGRHREADGFTLARVRGRYQRLFALVAIIAVLLQTFVVQTHIDDLVGLNPAAVEHANGASPAGPHVAIGSREPQTPCLICQTMATTGTTLLASDPALITALGLIVHEARLPIRHISVRPTHAWQSRAPPISL